jgi:hypothetical protein
MKFVVIGESSGVSMDTIRAVYPRHKAIVDAFVAKGEVIGIGPRQHGDFQDSRGGRGLFKAGPIHP